MRDLHSWKRLSGWQKGLLIAANDAQLCVYNTSSLPEPEVYQIIGSIRTSSDKLRYYSALHAERDVWGEVSHVQTLYLQLRERLATLRGFFLLFKQHQFFAELLNDALCRKGKVVSTVRDCVLSDRDDIIGGELELRTEDKAPPYFKISVSEDLEKDVYELASTISSNARRIFTVSDMCLTKTQIGSRYSRKNSKLGLYGQETTSLASARGGIPVRATASFCTGSALSAGAESDARVSGVAGGVKGFCPPLPLVSSFYFQHVLAAGLSRIAKHLLCKQSTPRSMQGTINRPSTTCSLFIFTQYRSSS